MHILFLTDNFPPEVNAPASRTFEHCREWVKGGHQVTIITCAPNFPTGKVFPGFSNKLWQSEEIEGIRVIRVWTYIAANSGFVKRILDYISFMPSAFIAAIFVKKADIVIGTSPQFFTVCAAYLVSVIKRIPFVFELRDIWPESIKAVGAMKDSRLIQLLEKIELFLYRKADLIISVTNSFKQILIKRGVEEGKIKVVTNGVDLSRFSQIDKDIDLLNSLGLQDKFVAGYVGTHGLAHGLETLLEAAEIAQHNDQDIMFLFLGNGARRDALISLAGEKELSNVIFIESVAKDEVVRYWSLLDVSIIHLKKMDLFTSVIPSKLFECMAMGIPIVHGVLGESAEIVKDSEAGYVFEPENAQELYDLIVKLKGDEKAYNYIQMQGVIASYQYNRDSLANKLIDLLSSMLHK